MLDNIILIGLQGYMTLVGDAGIKLSGGQRQRLAIARSIVKRPKILILDEATSSIDVRGERIVQAALEKVSKNRTTLVIAHRLATVKKADNIVVLRKGKVIQQGTHDSLMQQEGGPYWTLATAQQLHVVSSEEEDDGELKLKLKAVVEGEITEKKSTTTIGTCTDSTLVETTTTPSAASEGGSAKEPKTRGFWKSFGLLLRELGQQKGWYAVLLLSALGGGGRSIRFFVYLPLIVVMERN
jgi:ABC-type multidrug transport system ATPase subunit